MKTKRAEPSAENTRAYSVITVKALDAGKRTIRGIATTPRVDRVGDVILSMGVKFTNPLPLLHQHKSDKPVGTCVFKKPTEQGVEFEATLPEIDEPGPLKDRVDTAWGEVKAGLVRAVSIGFMPLKYSFLENGGIEFQEVEVYELSLVTIPAQPDAIIDFDGKSLDETIAIIKSIDAPLLAASGRSQRASSSPGVTGTRKSVSIRPKEAMTMKKSIAEQISAFEAARKEKNARMDDLLDASGEKGETLDAEQQEEYDGLADEVKAIDEHLKRLKDREARDVATAAAVEKAAGATAAAAAAARSHIQVKSQPKLAPGIGFARFVKCVGLAKGNLMQAEVIAKARYGENSDIVGVLKTAVAAGSTESGSWAEHLVGDETSVFADFVEFQRPQTIIGKFGTNGIPALRNVPFRTPLISQTGGGAGYWVGEGKAKPLTAFDFARTTLEPLKVANIAVVTKEVLMASSPSAEAIIRDSLAAALKERMDTDFIDPTKTASAGVSPASITTGISLPNSSGNDADSIREDLRTLFQTFIDANNAPTSGVWIMSAGTALALSLMMNALGQPEFPGVTVNGGTLSGLPVITSEYVSTVSAGSYVFLVNANDIYLADEGGISVDMSTEASLEMADNPAHNSTTPTAAQLVSLWQTNSVGFLAERTINWSKRRSSAVAGIDTVNWGQGS